MTPTMLFCAGLLCVGAPVPKVKVPEYAVHLRVGSTKIRLGEPFLVFFELQNNTERDLDFVFSFDLPVEADDQVGSYLKVRSMMGKSEEFRSAVICSTCYGRLLYPRMHSQYTPSIPVKARSVARYFDRILPPVPNGGVSTNYPFPDAGEYEVRAAFLHNGEPVYSKPVAVTVIDDRRAFEADITPFLGELESLCWISKGSRTWNHESFTAPDGLVKVAKKYPETSLPRILRMIELLRTLEKLKTKDEKLKHIVTMGKAVAGWSEVDASYLWSRALNVVDKSEDEVLDALSERITLWDATAARVRAKREKESKK